MSNRVRATLFSVAATAIVAVMAAGAQGGPAWTAVERAVAAPAAAAHTCKSGKHAVIAGKHRCLKVGQQCKRSRDAQFHRYGFHCHNGRVARNAPPAKKPKATLDSTAAVFGDQVTGRPGATRSVTVKNSGNAPLKIGAIVIEGVNAADFTSTGCSGETVGASTSCLVNVTFTPSAVGGRTARLRIPSNAVGSPHTITLVGNGVPPPSISGEGSSSSPPFRDCHHMTTRATVQPALSPPVVIATTRIWSDCFFGGFTGTAAVLVVDANGGTLDAIEAGTSWGVNGVFESTFDSPNDRTVSWEAAVPRPERLGLAASVMVVHTWAPRNRLLDIINKAVAVGQKAAEVAALIAVLIP